MSETINRDHSEECEEKKENLWWSNGYWCWYWYWYVRKQLKDQAKHHDRHRTLHRLRKGHDDLSVDTVIDLDSNVTKKNNSSASTVLATEITEHTNEMVAEENQMSSDDLISTGDYSD